MSSAAELRRWYWLASELQLLARHRGVSASGGKVELADRLAAVLDGRQPKASVPKPPPARQLAGPLGPDTVLPPGQRCTETLRAFFVGQLGRGFVFDGPMREFVRTGAGRTLGDGIEHWHASRSPEPSGIEPQFELNRFLRQWHLAHPAQSHRAALAAWQLHRALPLDRRPAVS